MSDGACLRLAEAAVEMLGCLSRRSGLRRVLLRLAQLADRRGQAHEVRGQGDRRKVARDGAMVVRALE